MTDNLVRIGTVKVGLRGEGQLSIGFPQVVNDQLQAGEYLDIYKSPDSTDLVLRKRVSDEN